MDQSHRNATVQRNRHIRNLDRVTIRPAKPDELSAIIGLCEGYLQRRGFLAHVEFETKSWTVACIDDVIEAAVALSRHSLGLLEITDFYSKSGRNGPASSHAIIKYVTDLADVEGRMMFFSTDANNIPLLRVAADYGVLPQSVFCLRVPRMKECPLNL